MTWRGPWWFETAKPSQDALRARWRALLRETNPKATPELIEQVLDEVIAEEGKLPDIDLYAGLPTHPGDDVPTKPLKRARRKGS